MLAEQLPESSAFVASMRGGREFEPWTLQNVLLAATANLLHAANHQRAGRKPSRPLVQPPQPNRRPARVVRIADVVARRSREAATRPK